MGRIVGQGINDQPPILSGTTAQRPTSANSGVLYYNTSKNILEIYNHNAVQWHVVGELPRVVITSSTSAVSNTFYIVNSAGGPVTVTLPGSPVEGDTVKFQDYSGTFGSNNLTVGANGLKIMRASDNMTVSTNGASFTLEYTDAASGWLVASI
jgi:hypothetical protein|tara:strand:- start:536 stop:994 length:459 start_codon:yes stop_codon:yes gene_type:complete